ncbi:MAG: alpha/beta hydrolase [Candidatus Melainabacteria bacterium]|nr:alpha/beta hydrolase [Candidatus Melainabacteria bacterium]
MDGGGVKDVSSEIRAAALEYVSPNGPRRVVRRPKTDVVAQEQKVPYRNGHLSVRSWGDGESVLLVHGWAANQTDMFSYVPPFLENGIKVIAMDLPSHGESSGEYAGLDRLAEGILAVGAHFGALRGVVAHSAGCAAAQLAISNGLVLDKAVMLASPINYEINAYRYAKARDYNEEQTQLFIQALADLDVRVAIRSVDFVPAFRLPALIVHCEDDAVIPVSMGEELSKFWTGSQLFKVNGLKHRGVLKDESVISRVVSFVIE